MFDYESNGEELSHLSTEPPPDCSNILRVWTLFEHWRAAIDIMEDDSEGTSGAARGCSLVGKLDDHIEGAVLLAIQQLLSHVGSDVAGVGVNGEIAAGGIVGVIAAENAEDYGAVLHKVRVESTDYHHKRPCRHTWLCELRFRGDW